jgi:hypothetical protein
LFSQHRLDFPGVKILRSWKILALGDNETRRTMPARIFNVLLKPSLVTRKSDKARSSKN